MKDFIKKITLSLALVFVFGSALVLSTGCNCNKEDEEDEIESKTTVETEAEKTTTEAATTEGATTEAATEAAVDGDTYPEDIHIEKAEYTGEGSGADAVYEVTVVLSPEMVKKGWNLGDLWAKIGGIPTMDDWDAINTYESSIGKEEDLPNGGKRVTWRTSLYFPNGAPKDGDEVTIGANAAGQDENGNWSEGEIAHTVTVKWATK